MTPRWHYADDAARAELGDDPPERFAAGMETVKANAVRRVTRSGGYYFKFDRRPRKSFAREFAAARQLAAWNIPTVRHAAWGQTATEHCLITAAAPGFVEAAHWVRDRRLPETFLAGFADLARRLFRAPLFHPDLHLGNLLYAPESGEFMLVDLHGVRRRTWFDRLFRSYRMYRFPLELRDRLSDGELTMLLERCGVPRPAAFLCRALRREAAFLRREFPRRERQIRAGYAKFSRREPDGALYDSGASAAELAAAETVACAEPERLLVFHFFLTLAHIPHRRVLAAFPAQKQIALDNPPPEEAAPDGAASQLTRLAYYRLDGRRADFRDGILYDIAAVFERNREVF